jgi:hypothetical protein
MELTLSITLCYKLPITFGDGEEKRKRAKQGCTQQLGRSKYRADVFGALSQSTFAGTPHLPTSAASWIIQPRFFACGADVFGAQLRFAF